MTVSVSSICSLLSCACIHPHAYASSFSLNMHRLQQALKLNFAVVLCNNSHVREKVGESVWNHSGGLFKYGSALFAVQAITSLPVYAHLPAGTKWVSVTRRRRERGICFMQSDFQVCFLTWGDFLQEFNTFPLHLCLALLISHVASKKDNLQVRRWNSSTVCVKIGVYHRR